MGQMDPVAYVHFLPLYNEDRKIKLYSMPCNAKNDNDDDSILSKVLFLTIILVALFNGVIESILL